MIKHMSVNKVQLDLLALNLQFPSLYNPSCHLKLLVAVLFIIPNDNLALRNTIFAVERSIELHFTHYELSDPAILIRQNRGTLFTNSHDTKFVNSISRRAESGMLLLPKEHLLLPSKFIVPYGSSSKAV